MIETAARSALEASDSGALLKLTNRLCKAQSWNELTELRQLCAEAVSRGKQLWAVAEHIRYRLILEGPPHMVGAMLAGPEPRFGLGPLPEVAASRLGWDDLADHLPPGPVATAVAMERAARGEDLSRLQLDIAELPAKLQPWEPTYPMATYHPNRVEAPSPSIPATRPVAVDAYPISLDDPESLLSLENVVLAWTTESNGRSATVAAEGPVTAALALIGAPSIEVGTIEPREALAWLGWAGASGGAHGRRRGAAAGRAAAWWVVANLCDLPEPLEAAAVGEAADGLTWYWWTDLSPDTGWFLRIAAEDPKEGISWAIGAADA